MTAAVRNRLKLAVDARARQRLDLEVLLFGSDYCMFCGAVIEPRPRRKFCSEACRKRDHEQRTFAWRRAA